MLKLASLELSTNSETAVPNLGWLNTNRSNRRSKWCHKWTCNCDRSLHFMYQTNGCRNWQSCCTTTDIKM